MARNPDDDPPWAEAFRTAAEDDVLERARRREAARAARKGLWSAVGAEADPELASTPGHDPSPISADEAGPQDADATWIPIGTESGGGQDPEGV